MDASELDYALPESLIAQQPPPNRDAARLLVLDAGRTDPQAIAHRRTLELPRLVPPSLIVVNDTRVLAARLRGNKPTGGAVELLLVEKRAEENATCERWLALGKASKGLRPGTEVHFEGLRATVLAREEDGLLEVRLETEGDPVDATIERIGAMPLPPYIRRPAEAKDRERYQTIFAREPGAVAAPTAGLHFSPRLVEAAEAAGHRIATVTLHVGPGTFRPVKAERLDAHPMHEERFRIPEVTALAIEKARQEERPVLAVGTTVVRTLEAAAAGEGLVRPGEGRTDLFIRPPYSPRVVDHVLTNFHLPRSTLLALVMALGGIEPVRRAYRAAVEEAYRFFSYGDAMLLRTLR